jgi:DNA-binding transcriptional LysR family regulator
MNCFNYYHNLFLLFGMDVRDLEVFLAVTKHLNFTRAGEDIHLSQPTVSVRIGRLEEELGVELFEQVGKKVMLTEAGRLLELHARRVVTALDDARQAIEEFQGLERGSLRIGASTTPGMYLVPRIITEFKRQHPKIEIFLGIKNTRQVEEDIIKNEFDLGFVGGHLISDEVEAVLWRTDALVLIVPPGHPWASRRWVKLNDLANERFIVRERGSATRALVENNLGALKLSLAAAVELGNPEAVKQAVMGGLGMAVLSKFAVEPELKAKTLVALKVKGLNITRQLKIVYRKGKHLSRAAASFIETAQQL